MKDEFPAPLATSGPQPLWDPARDYIRVVLRDMQVEARVGLHPWEKHPERPHRLVVNVELFAHLPPDRHASSRPIIDYDPIHDALKSWPGRPHVPLLETLVEEVIELCFGIEGVAACRVSILKPDIFSDAAAAGVEIYRRRPAKGRG